MVGIKFQVLFFTLSEASTSTSSKRQVASLKQQYILWTVKCFCFQKFPPPPKKKVFKKVGCVVDYRAS